MTDEEIRDRLDVIAHERAVSSVEAGLLIQTLAVRKMTAELLAMVMAHQAAQQARQTRRSW